MTEDKVLQSLLSLYEEEKGRKLPLDKGLFYSFLDDCKKLLILDFLRPDYEEEDARRLLLHVKAKLNLLLSDYQTEDPVGKTEFFLSELPKTRELLIGSAHAILEGDPACDSVQEVILCYPGVKAIQNYRIANILYRMGLRFLSRLATEDAHRSTGIDINPGATIGKNFFIDHGTGIVIGETTIIGDDVKLYQGVTLGALSLREGQKLQGKKRHPTVESGCTIYSNASILGGETVIGRGSTIGANTYLLHSVPPYSRVILTTNGVTIMQKGEKQDQEKDEK